MTTDNTVTRRDFLKGTAGLLIGSALRASPVEGTNTLQKSRVVLIRDARSVGADGTVNPEALREMLDQALVSLQAKDSILSAWKSLFSASDTVGIKTNVWRYLPTPRELEAVIRGRLIDAGVNASNIAVDDRGVLDNPVFLKATALVNARPLRTHHWSGVGSCLKNYIMFSRTPSDYHPDGCADLGRLWTLPVVRGKTRLNIQVALTPQFYGRGAHSFDRRYVWPYKGLIVGTDPVAVDAIGAELLRAKRISFFGDDRSLDVQPVHIAVAEKKYHLGVSDLRRIDLVRIGWKDEVLI